MEHFLQDFNTSVRIQLSKSVCLLQEQQKSFRRRQVVSNWERYEGTASLTEDTPTLRGADFKAIVEAGGRQKVNAQHLQLHLHCNGG